MTEISYLTGRVVLPCRRTGYIIDIQESTGDSGRLNMSGMHACMPTHTNKTHGEECETVQVCMSNCLLSCYTTTLPYCQAQE